MSAKTFSIEFEGYWRDEYKTSVPNKSGVYCVYTCYRTAELKKRKKIEITNLVYIGESAKVRERIANHELREDWEAYLGKGEELCFSFAAIPNADNRERIEAALIFYHKPPVNTEYVDSFPFDETTVKVSGKTAELAKIFTVQTTP